MVGLSVSPPLTDHGLEHLQATNPRYVKNAIESKKGPKIQECCRWIFSHPEFEKWRHQSDSELLWIQSDAGKGKTMLLAGIVDELQPQKNLRAESERSQPTTVAYFFCERDHDQSRPEIKDATAVLRGLICLLIDSGPTTNFPHRPSDFGSNSYQYTHPDSLFALSEKLVEIVHAIETRVYLIVDAFDEYDHKDYWAEVLDQMLTIRKGCHNVRWLVSSRKHHGIGKWFQRWDTTGRFIIELCAQSISPAVNHYIEMLSSNFGWLEENEKLREEVCCKIKEKADSTFLWASLICKELQMVDGSSQLQLLENGPVNLVDMKWRVERCELVCKMITDASKLYKEFKRQFGSQPNKSEETKEDKSRVYDLLEDSITLYKLAISKSRNLNPAFHTGIIRANIGMADSYRELSHKHQEGFTLICKLNYVETAEKCIGEAIRLAKKSGDKKREQRAEFEKAVLGVRKVLIKKRMKDPDANIGRTGLLAQADTARNILEAKRDQHKEWAGWANTWLTQLNEAIKELNRE